MVGSLVVAPREVGPEPTGQCMGASDRSRVLRGCACWWWLLSKWHRGRSVPHGRQPVNSLAEALTWPWEFDTYEWFRRASPLDRRDLLAWRLPPTQSAPDFEQYLPTQAEAPTPESASEMAGQLVQQLKLPVSKRLYLVVLA